MNSPQNQAFRPHLRPDGVPTRADVTLMSGAELKIREAIAVVEESGASEFLTQAVVLLSRAQELVADHVEGQADVMQELERREGAMFDAMWPSPDPNKGGPTDGQ